MKKSIFGAIALSAALAIGTTMPAFAAGVTPTANEPGYLTDSSDAAAASYADVATFAANTTDDTADSAVYIITKATNINVTVPLKVVFAAETGGGTLGTPTDGLYRIESHTTTVDLYVTALKVDTTPGAGNWKLTSKDDGAGTDLVGVGVTSDPADNLKFGNIYVQMTKCKADGGATGGTAWDKDLATIANIQNTDPDYAAASTIKIKGDVMKLQKEGSDTYPVCFKFAGQNSVLNDKVASALVNGVETFLNPDANAFNLVWTIATAEAK